MADGLRGAARPEGVGGAPEEPLGSGGRGAPPMRVACSVDASGGLPAMGAQPNQHGRA